MHLQTVLERVREKTGAQSERKLARELGISPAGVRYLLGGHGCPSEETMLRIANICSIEPGEALLILNMWRAKGQARAIYAKLHQTLTEKSPQRNEGGKNRKQPLSSKENKSPR